MNKNPKILLLLIAGGCALSLFAAETNAVADLGSITVEANALSKYRPAKVEGATFTGEAPEKLPTVVDTLTEDFIRERNPTDMNDLLRQVPGIETGGTSLLVRQPGLFSIRGMGGTEPSFDGVIPVGRGAGLFMDPYMMERVEIVKGPIASLSGGAGAQQNNNGAGGSINMYLKSARLDESVVNFQETTSVGRNIWRQRGMIDANEVLSDDHFAIRLPASFDIYSPTYISSGSQEGARPREQYTLAPSFIMRPNDEVTFGLKTMFISSDSPSYIGVPVWRGAPAAGYTWNESSCLKTDRSVYKGMMINPYVDWQVTEDWLLKFGGAFMYSHAEHDTREPYYAYKLDASGRPTGEFADYCRTGYWTSGNKYAISDTGFQSARWFSRNFNLYARSVYTKNELPWGFRNTFLVQPDFYYRDSSVTSFGSPTSRYGATLQDSVGWGWVNLLAGIRYDYFVENDNDQTNTSTKKITHYAEAREHAFSPRGGLTIQPLDWLVFFGNVSETVTPTLGYRDAQGLRPADPWTALQWEPGLRIQPLEKLWISASYFNIDQKNMPVQDRTTQAVYFDGHNRSQGVDLSLTGDITKDWTVMAMYTFTRFENVSANPYKGEKRVFERTPAHAVTFNTSYRLHGWDAIENIIVGLGYRFRSKSYACMQGKFVDENLYFNPSHVFDVNASVPLSKFGWRDDWYLTFAVRNLFDERYFDTSRHFYECFAGDPRTFEIGLRGKF